MKNLAGLLGLLFVLVVLYVASTRMPVNAAAPAALPQHQDHAASSQKTATPDTPVTGAPSLSAKFIDSVLCKAQSPACHTGQDLYQLGEIAGIDPAYTLAFFQHESSFGRAGVTVATKGMGNIRCSAGYQCADGFRAYSTWRDSYADWYKLIAWYINDLHKHTLRQILYTYAPPADHNNTDGYIQAVCQAVNSWRQEARA